MITELNWQQGSRDENDEQWKKRKRKETPFTRNTLRDELKEQEFCSQTKGVMTQLSNDNKVNVSQRVDHQLQLSKGMRSKEHRHSSWRESLTVEHNRNQDEDTCQSISSSYPWHVNLFLFAFLLSSSERVQDSIWWLYSVTQDYPDHTLFVNRNLVSGILKEVCIFLYAHCHHRESHARDTLSFWLQEHSDNLITEWLSLRFWFLILWALDSRLNVSDGVSLEELYSFLLFFQSDVEMKTLKRVNDSSITDITERNEGMKVSIKHHSQEGNILGCIQWQFILSVPSSVPWKESSFILHWLLTGLRFRISFLLQKEFQKKNCRCWRDEPGFSFRSLHFEVQVFRRLANSNTILLFESLEM